MIAPEGYGKQDFERMMFNVMDVPEKKDVLEVFPELKSFIEFTAVIEYEDEIIDKNKILKYVFLLYDHNSPLKQHDNLIKRKIVAAQIAGFKTDKDGYFEPAVDLAMRGLLPEVNRMIIRFCRIYGSAIYSALITVTEAYYYKLQLTLSPSSEHKTKSEIEIEKIKGQLWLQSKEMMLDINQLTKDLLNEDNSPYLKKDLFCVIERESQDLLLTPEKIAKHGKVEA